MTDVCFSQPALSLLGTVWIVIQAALLGLFWLLIRAKDARAARAEAKEDEWRRVALRGVDEIVPLAREVRGQVRDRWPELREPETP